MSKSAALFLTKDGDLHLYCDEMYAKTLQTGLPVDEPLYGGVDVLGCCVQIKSEILRHPDMSNALHKLSCYCTILCYLAMHLLIVIFMCFPLCV